MVTLIAEDYPLIQVMTRFGIRMGFGDKTVEEVCLEAGVDCNTFLAVVNFVSEGFTTFNSTRALSIKSLMHYLKQSHIYFLEYCLPMIRRKLLDGISLNTKDVSFLIIRFFDEYYREVKTHMEYEERTVFQYIESLLDGIREEGFRIATYSDHHEQVADKLGELKNLIIKYCPKDSDANLLNDALYSIYRCERELENHCKVEDFLLVPEIKRLEKSVKDYTL
ncbi:MAG: hemerythrin domain-containing protein [Muribaculaceae bacterium]|nr:hemerythrin domain-containing protein [Muribaculaceae bacterium]